jgi:hypothetical protein
MKEASMNSNISSRWPAKVSPRPPELVVAAKGVLQQGLDLLEFCSEQYAVVAPIPFDASIGQHYRHILEHFQCLLQGANSGEVNYDKRKRDARLETEVSFATRTTHDVMRQIELWSDATLGERCNTVSSLAYHSDSPSFIASNLGRELAYCIGHAIHHFAIIRLLCSEINAEVPADFGYAPSTLKYHSNLSVD